MSKKDERQLAAVVQWHITAKCINRCKHCYTYGENSKECVPESDLSWEQLLLILNNIKIFEERYSVRFNNFYITGGDPLSSCNGWRLIEKLRSEGRNVSILGIPERVNLDMIRRFKSLKLSAYQVSLDGLEKTHDYIRGKGSFKRTIEAVKMLESNNIDYCIMYTVHNLNQFELIPLLDYLQEQGLKGNVAFDFMIGETRQTDDMSPRMLTAEEAEKVVRDFHDKEAEICKKNGKMKLYNKTSMNTVLSLIDEGYYEGEEVLFEGCGVGNHLAILADGTVYPCRRLPIPIGNLLEDSLEDIYLNHPLMKRFRRREEWKDCHDCKFFNMCMGCPAVSFAFTGDPFEKMEYCFLKEVTDGKYEKHFCKEKREEIYYLRDKLEEEHASQKNVEEIWNGLKIRPDLLKNFLKY